MPTANGPFIQFMVNPLKIPRTPSALYIKLRVPPMLLYRILDAGLSAKTTRSVCIRFLNLELVLEMLLRYMSSRCRHGRHVPHKRGYAVGGTPSAKFGTSLTLASSAGSSSRSVSARNSSKSVGEHERTV
mgnify:CR=1 FL=1